MHVYAGLDVSNIWHWMIPSFQLVELFPFNLLYVEMISEDQTSICTCTTDMFGFLVFISTFLWVYMF